jgi:hypothetical protein
MVIHRELCNLVDSMGSYLLVCIFCPLLQDALSTFIPARVDGRKLDVLGSSGWYPSVLAAAGFGEFSATSAAAATVVSTFGTGLDCRKYRREEQVEDWTTTWETGADNADVGFNDCPHGGLDIV